MADNLETKYKKVKETIQKYPSQVKQAWEEVRGIHVPNDYHNVQNIVFCGMGGSALGARMIDSYAVDTIQVPFEIFTEYKIPWYVNDKTLVIISSYSGSTEETLSCLEEAKRKRAKIFVITTGGELADIMQTENIPGYIFEPRHNPSGQPRLSIGYAAAAVLALISTLGFAVVKDEDIYSALSAMQETVSHFSDDTSAENTAYNLAQKLNGKIPVLVGSEHLVGTLHSIKNQFNESAKTFATLFDLPELNHHLMEGLANPETNKNNLHFVFFNSHIYTPRVQKRYPLTQEVVTKNNIEHTMYAPTSSSKVAQMFETLIFGSFVVYYLTKSHDIDPIEIPWVDYFKEELNDK